MDRFQEKITNYLRNLAEKSTPIRQMYFYDNKFENIPVDLERDILLEKEMTLCKGLVHKFTNRVAVLISYTCAAHCRYCERQDRVGVGLDREGRLHQKDLDEIYLYLEENSNVNEVIFTGGDPFTNMQGLFYLCNKLRQLESIKIIRIHTRFPLQFPSKVNFEILNEIINSSKKAFYLSIHVNHPDELNETTIPILKKMKELGFIMLSQSVFLKGINDSVQTLSKLFSLLTEIGIRPYYIYHCQSIPTTSRFVMKIKDEIEIMSRLRERISGIAYPHHVIDLQDSVGKVLVPTNHWNIIKDQVKDYNGKIIKIDDLG